MKKTAMLRTLTAVILAAGMTVGLAACQKNGDSSPERKTASEIKKENQVSDTGIIPQNPEGQEVQGERTQYPITVTTYGSDGSELATTYEKAPEKVLAVYQGCIETMLALGLEDHIVGAAGLDNEVPDAQKSTFSKLNYLDEFTPSLETVTMLEPDMIFSWGSLFGDKTLGDAENWVEKGTNIYINSNTCPGTDGNKRTLENEYTDILNIGKIFDVQGKAQTIVSQMKETIETVKEKSSASGKEQTVLILEPVKDSFTNYGADSLGGDMVTQLGGILANPDGSVLGKEDVISADPDVIFVVYMPYAGDDPEQVKKEQLQAVTGEASFQSLKAVREGRVVPVMLSEMYASATRTQDGIETFARGLYPEMEE